MNRRDWLRTMLAAPMMAVAARFGFADTVDPCADLPWHMRIKTLTREEMTEMFGPMPCDVTIDLVPCINCGGEGGHIERFGPSDRAATFNYPCARCSNPGRLWGESWIEARLPCTVIDKPFNWRFDP